MKAFFRWIGKIVGSVVTIAFVIILFPHLSRLAGKLLPDEGGASIKASAILATKLENSSRLETLKVDEDGVLNYDIRAAFLGTVASVNISYRYEASFGIDLSKVLMQVTGNEIVFVLPCPELIRDTLTPVEVYEDDFWYKGFSLEDYEKLLEEERIARRNVYLSGDNHEMLWNATVTAFEETITQWLENVNNNLNFRYVEARSEEQN